MLLTWKAGTQEMPVFAFDSLRGALARDHQSVVTTAAAPLMLAAPQHGPVLGIAGTAFSLDGKPTFLLGASYYAGLGIGQADALEEDLDDLAALGFNWVRVWATWDAFEHNVSAVAPDGSVRRPYMGRLKRLCRAAGRRRMVVDVTVTRGKSPNFPAALDEHRAVMETLAKHLKPYRNVYFDIGNERNVGDARHVPIADVGELIRAVKRIDPQRLCTASQGGDIPPAGVVAYIDTGRVDFICPHRPRNEASPGQTAGRTQQYFEQMAGASRVVPVHYQEAFRRDYGRWQPVAAHFAADLEAARSGGAAGWCFHNGSVRTRAGGPHGRPSRSFDMRAAQGRLFDQLDAEERRFLRQAGSPDERPGAGAGGRWPKR